MPAATPEPAGRLLAIGRLLRLSLAATAAADVAAGMVLAGAGTLPDGRTVALVLASSLGIVHGALALNDWNDREHDARTRPDRPLPSGRVSPRLALGLGAGLVLVGVALGFLAAPRLGAWALGLAALAVGYDLRGRGPWIGPTLLGLCRFGNLGYGLLAGSAATAAGAPRGAFLVAASYGAYVFTLSRLGRLEDGEDEDLSRPGPLLFALGVLLLSPGLLGLIGLLGTAGNPIGALFALLLTGLGAHRLFSLALRTERWTPPEVGAAMGVALRRLLVFTAAVALLPGTSTALFVAIAIGLGFPLSAALRRVFPPS